VEEITMPTLEWIGKNKVVNHHQEVPYRVLERQYSYDEAGQHAEDNGSKNMVIHGDNLEALKALLPQYEGKVKCIYIDPPYNTGNEGWVYNDNVNDPKIKKWLGEVVGKEGEDLSRHDKWLCMMYPRLKLLQRLLAEDGAIFISIDDIEYTNLKLVCDEIFGSPNYRATLIWHSRQRADNRNKTMLSVDHEYILLYSKSESFSLKGVQKDISKYKNPDNDPRGPWASIDLSGLANAQQRPNLHYDIVDPITGNVYPPNPNRGWSKSRENVERMISEGRIIFPKSPSGRPREKKFLKDLLSENTGFSSILTDEVGYTTDGTRIMRKLFAEAQFDFPKSLKLIQTIVEQSTSAGDIILDSFAGSGTTAHAVLNMNKADSGNRKFILVEMMDYADSITAERVKRVIDGYGESKKAVEGTGGNFSYYELGPVLLLPDGNLNEEVGPQKIREYVYYMETKEPLPAEQSGDEPYFVGLCRNTAYYFYYERESVTTLDYAFLATVQTKAEGYTIYADLCAIPQETLRKYNITFKKIPRDIARL
jgi:adenine-specific DNA-methyltransferase